MVYKHYLVAEKRKSYFDEKGKDEECIFCTAVPELGKAPGRAGKSWVIASFSTCFIVVNEYPYVSKGHLMVVPKRHVVDYNELTSDEIDEIFKVVLPKAKGALAKEYKRTRGFNIGMNMGDNAGASIQHLHVHIVPRTEGETGFMETTASTRIVHEDAETTMNKMSKHFMEKK